MQQKSETIAINPRLSYGLNFDSRDLSVNKQGRISSRQVRLLRDKRRQQPASSSWTARIRGSLFYLMVGVTPQKHQWNLVGADITATTAQRQRGQVKLPQSFSRKVKGSPHAIYRIAVGQQPIHVDRRALHSFRDRDAYTVYYAPCSKHALSAEIDN